MASTGEAERGLREALADRYRIEGAVGSGGMATVYLAQDLKHDRKVAVKVLKPELAAVLGAERFLSEIATTAHLQHPNILPLFDSGEAGGQLFYVMPYVEGENLRDRLNREKQLPIDEAVRIATEVAEALQAAHDEGVIHRDIKPANILLRKGKPLVADFGIALAVSAAGEGRLTETGLSLGTPYYMSPEQASADRDPDARSDIYSLGCVLYEMLAGEPPFTGTTAQSVLAKILTEDAPHPSTRRRAIPPNVEGAILKAVERLPTDRFGSAAAFRAALMDQGFRYGARDLAAPGIWKPLSAALAVVVLAMSAVLLILLSGDLPRPVFRVAAAFPEGQELNNVVGVSLAFTPDGSHLVYVGPGERRGTQLWVRPASRLNAVPILGTVGAMNPAPSPNGEFVAFIVGDSLSVVPLDGGTPRALVPGVVGPNGIDWGEDGFVYYRHLDGRLFRVPWIGGEPEELLRPDSLLGITEYRWPDVLPGGRGVLISDWTGVLSETSVSVLDLRSGEKKELLPNAMMARYLGPGYILYCDVDGNLWAASFDARSFGLRGSAILLPEVVWVRAGAGSQFTVSERGHLAYIPGTGAARQLVWVNRDGESRAVDRRLSGDLTQPSLSPDGTRLAFVRRGESNDGIWVFDTLQSTLSLVAAEGRNATPFWNPAGDRVAYVALRNGTPQLLSSRWDGSGVPSTLSEDRRISDATWTPDGRALVASVMDSTNDLVRIPLDGRGVSEPLVATRFMEDGADVSPDGKWVAYNSDVSGRWEVYVVPFPGPGDRTQVSLGTGGTEPRWSPAGGELFYRDGSENLVVASVTTEAGFRVVGRQVLFSTMDFVYREVENRRLQAPTRGQYDVSPDGRTFLFVQFSGITSGPVIVLNVDEEIRALIGGGQ